MPLDLETLLQPISSASPAGEDLRESDAADALYYQLKDARNDARSHERRAEGGDPDDASLPDWERVSQLAQTVLAQHSKDLEAAVYLIEAQLRLEGFGGLREGFFLAHELIQRYWDDLHPSLEYGLEARLAHISGLNGRGSEGALIRPILLTPLTAGTTVGSFACAHYLQARQLESLSDAEREHRLQGGAVSMEVFERSAAETPPEYFQANREQLAHCIEEFRLLTEELNERCGDDAPHSSQIRETLELCQETLGYIGGSPHVQAAAPEPTAAASPAPAYSPPSAPAPINGPQNREEALEMLRQVAAFYRYAEPHSPMSWAAEQLVSWGQKPLPELLAELIPDVQARSFFQMRTGMEQENV